MPDLSFAVESAQAVAFAATPAIAFKLRIANADPLETVHAVALRCQIQIESARRRYTAAEQAQMIDLFGEPDRWSQTLRTMMWTHASLVAPAFNGSVAMDLQVSCTFDFNVAATKYFHGLEGGEIPLLFLFSGTVFYADDQGQLRVAPISWDKETKYPLPCKTWKEMMDAYYPNSVWLSLRKDVFEQLNRYKMTHGVATWEQALEKMLAESEEAVRP